MKSSITTLLFVFALAILGNTVYQSIKLKQNCTGYLKRAGDANRAKTALSELRKATSYLEANNLTNGYTSIFWQTPDEDISFWYKNLKQSESELESINSETSSMEESNVLLKLRETLMDNTKNGDTLTRPGGLSRFPNNGIYALFNTLAILYLMYLLFYYGYGVIGEN